MKLFSMVLAFALILTSCGSDSLSANAVASNGGECPVEHQIKGNRNTKGEWIYHVPDGQYYTRTSAEECFATEADAENAGYRKSKR